MSRILTTAAFLALSLAAAQAGDTLASRIHDAAVAACAPERSSSTIPISHYGAIFDQCVSRVSNTATAKYQADAKAAAARGKLAGN